MAEALQAAGASILWGSRVAAAARRQGGWALDVVSGALRREMFAPLLVIADGRFSTLSGRRMRKTRTGWFGWNASFVGVAQAPGSLSLHFHTDGYVGALTFGDAVTNVCGLVRLDGTRPPRWEEILASAVRDQPALARLLRSATRTDAFRGVGPLPFSIGMTRGRGALLAGDAAAVGDPYMGEGISRALGTGPALLAAIRHGGLALGADAPLAGYSRAWRGRYLPRLRLGAVARWIFGHPGLAEPVLRQVLSRPGLRRHVLNVAHGSAGARER